MKRNIYKHEISLEFLKIKNIQKDLFKEKLEQIKYKGYEVEQIKDGRKIVITKPGGKFTFGTIRREDFMVWIFNPNDNSLWLISHKDIMNDLIVKADKNKKATLNILYALEKVYNGEDPDEIILKLKDPLINPVGELPEVLLKAYKWIWGQEDANYPNGKGRAMSWEGWVKSNNEWEKTNNGLNDLIIKLKSEIE